MTRKLLVTSVGSGVGHAILAALRRSEAPWYVVGVNSAAFNAGDFDCDSAWLAPPVADRAAFEARLIEVVEAEGPALILPGRECLPRWRWGGTFSGTAPAWAPCSA